MANNQRRMVYAKIWTSQQFGRLSPKARLLYIGMITLADDDGRLVGEAAYLRGQIFPYDDISAEEMKSLKKEVTDLGLVEAYSVDSFDYIQHPKWTEYQKIRRDLYVTSTLPPRYGTVTKPLHKRTLSKDKISKDKTIPTAQSADGAANPLIQLFEQVNPNYATLFARIPQRKAAERLLKVHPLDWWEKFMPAYYKALEDRYCPRATTPLEMETKLGQIEAYGRSKKNEKSKTIVI